MPRRPRPGSSRAAWRRARPLPAATSRVFGGQSSTRHDRAHSRWRAATAPLQGRHGIRAAPVAGRGPRHRGARRTWRAAAPAGRVLLTRFAGLGFAPCRQLRRPDAMALVPGEPCNDARAGRPARPGRPQPSLVGCAPIRRGSPLFPEEGSHAVSACGDSRLRLAEALGGNAVVRLGKGPGSATRLAAAAARRLRARTKCPAAIVISPAPGEKQPPSV